MEYKVQSIEYKVSCIKKFAVKGQFEENEKRFITGWDNQIEKFNWI